MSDSSKSVEGSTQQDPIQNLKGEFNRKLEGLNGQISSLAEMNKTLLSKLDGLSKPAPDTSGSSTDDASMIFEKPNEFIKKLKSEVLGEVDSRISTVQAHAAQTNQTVATLYDQYPELNSAASELSKKANEILQGMSNEERRNPKFLKVAVLEAAAELSIAPKKQRKAEDTEPDVSFGYRGGRFGGNEGTPKTLREAEGNMMELAELMGVKTSDKETAARLKSRLKKMSR